MASKAKTRVKLSSNGRNVVATIPIERLRALLPSLPDGPERQILEAALGDADVGKANQIREARLNTPLSIESLAPLGWMMTGEHSPIAYGAVRNGDFRYEGDGHWAFGPPGAFDREPDGVEVVKAATQAGVMSEEHAVYRLLTPTSDRCRAIAEAMRLEAEWRRELPAKARKPKALREGGVFGDEAKGMLHSDWPGYMTSADLDGLPQGARIARRRRGGRPVGHDWKFGDVVHGGDGRTCVAMFECDAVLRPLIVSTGSARGRIRQDGRSPLERRTAAERIRLHSRRSASSAVGTGRLRARLGMGGDAQQPPEPRAGGSPALHPARRLERRQGPARQRVLPAQVPQ